MQECASVTKSRLFGVLAIAAALGFLAAGPVRAQSVEEFYRNNVVELYISFSVGGGYDVHGRLVARHIGKHIPGNPTVIPLNMEGAGGLKFTNWLFNAAPKDGTVFGIISRGIPFEPLVGIAPPDTLRFEPTEFTWIGSTSSEVSVCVAWEGTGIDKFSDLYERELIVGGIGAGGDPDIFPRIMTGVLGTRFRIVSGYPGGADIDFALERGEVDGRCGWSWTSILSSNMAWVTDGRIKILIQLALKPHPDLTAMGVPWIMDMAKSEEDLQLFRMIFARGALGRPFIAPPGLPPDRAAALQQAFEDTMKDPEFLAEAARARLEIAPMTGPEVKELIEEIYATPRPIVERARAMLRP